MVLAQHLTITDQHITPRWLIRLIQIVLGQIQLDPCSDQRINEWSVNALRYFDHNGLKQLEQLSKTERGLKVFCNPPGGKIKNQSQAAIWFKAMYQHWRNGLIDQCFFLAFNPELDNICSEINYYLPRFKFATRLHYWSWNDVFNEFQQGQWSYTGNKNSNHIVTIVKRPTSSYWSVEDGELLIDNFGYQKEAIDYAKNLKCRVRYWSDRPPHPSTLWYFPSRNADQWISQYQLIRRVFLDVRGSWTTPIPPKSILLEKPLTFTSDFYP